DLSEGEVEERWEMRMGRWVGGRVVVRVWRWVEAEMKVSRSESFEIHGQPRLLLKRNQTSEKQMGSTPLRRFERGKNHVDVPISPVKSTEKSVDISKESAEDGSRDSNVGSKKQKRYHVIELMADYNLNDSERLIPKLVPNGVVSLSDSTNDMVSGSHTSEKHVGNATILSKPVGEASAKQDANMVNDVAWAGTTIFSESIEDILANHDADATVLSQSIRDTLAIEEFASEHQDEVENVISGDDAV
nr:hypothetical protein [Tanacetum cinerariifolium]